MKFGLFMLNDKPPGMSDAESYANALEQCRVADELGYDVLWLGEHHFAPYGTVADTLVFAAAVSQVTKTIQIGTAVVVPIFNHPVRVAEQVAMVDVLSGGRFILGVGRGYQSREFAGFGVPQDQSKVRFRECMQIVEGLLTHENFSYQGQFWSVEDLTIAPQPLRKPPELPIMYAVSRSPDSYEFVAEFDYTPFIGNPYSVDPGVATGRQLYVDALTKFGKGDQIKERLDRSWGMLGDVFAWETSQEAAEKHHVSWGVGNSHLWNYARVVEEGEELPEDYKAFEGWMDWLKAGTYEDMLESPFSLVGSPDLIVERLHKIHELYGLGNFIIWMNRGGATPQKDMLHNMEVFAEKVMPQVKHLSEATAPAPRPEHPQAQPFVPA
jgi:alkanesulfonate monooxygenase SsuD/methylene tetrahydromethanopterin reductase-like flavin-dependent oxidoreductase (luciferase family)